MFRAAVVVALVAFVAQCIAFVHANAQTYDEGINLAAGLRFLDTGVDDVNGEHPPFAKALMALPVKLFAAPHVDVAAWRARQESGFGLGRDVLYAGGVSHERLLGLGRAPIVLFALGLVALIGGFARRLWGPRAGLLALVLAAFDPNLVAHGSVMGLDMPITFFFTLALFALNEFVTSHKMRWLALAGVASGLVLSTKHSGPLLVVAVLVALVARALHTGDVPSVWDVETDTHQGKSRSRALARAAFDALALVAVALVVVKLVHGRAGYEAYLVGLRAQLAHQGAGHPAFFLGEVSRAGWASYFPIALLLKMPPLTLALALASTVVRRAERGGEKGEDRFRSALSVVGVPFAVVFFGLLFVRIDVGVRYALPIMPLLVVWASRVATSPMGNVAKIACGLGLAHHVVAAVRIAPHDLAFFSDAVGGPSRGARYLADSNLDWGQDVGTLGRWMALREPPRRLYLSYFGSADPRAYGVRFWPAPNACPHPAPWSREPEPEAGKEYLAVSAMNLQGVFFQDPSAYAWLGGRVPVAILGHSISVFDITGDLAAHRELLRMYLRFGPPGLASVERERVRALEGGTP
ncbi:MAG: glycosyltransferase family 39 protein [Polyangiaceae bacterium]